jgi:hypothetical protein
MKEKDIKSNNKKNEQLEMPYGTARNKLNKAIMFEMMKRCNMDICHQCGNKIENVDELSVEHKTPWLDSGKAIELFFNLENIAFSHLSCNCAASRKVVTVKNAKIPPSGFRGVQLSGDSRPGRKKYVAYFSNNGKQIRLGSSDSPRELALLYDKKAIEVLGEEAVTNASLGLL